MLVAEDNVDHLELLSDALSVDNEVVGTDSRDECLALLSQQRFNLVVLDYNLKKKFSGFDILKEITHRYPHLPVIMVTAYGSEDLAVKVMKTGARDYIRKTLDNNYIERIVRNVKALIRTCEKPQEIADREEAAEYLRAHREPFIQSWQQKIHLSLKNERSIDWVAIAKPQFELLLTAYLADLQNDNATETIRFFKEVLQINNYEYPFFYLLEVLNSVFKEVALDYLQACCHPTADYKSSIYFHLDRIVGENGSAIRDILYNTLEAGQQE